MLKRSAKAFEIAFIVLIMVACGQTQPISWIPENWNPSLQQVREQLGSLANQAAPVNQQALSQASQLMADSADAQLFITYVQLMQRLDHAQRSELFEQQAAWLALRTQQAGAAVVSQGGSLAPLEYNNAFIEITEARLKELQQRGAVYR